MKQAHLKPTAFHGSPNEKKTRNSKQFKYDCRSYSIIACQTSLPSVCPTRSESGYFSAQFARMQCASGEKGAHATVNAIFHHFPRACVTPSNCTTNRKLPSRKTAHSLYKGPKPRIIYKTEREREDYRVVQAYVYTVSEKERHTKSRGRSILAHHLIAPSGLSTRRSNSICLCERVIAKNAPALSSDPVLVVVFRRRRHAFQARRSLIITSVR